LAEALGAGIDTDINRLCKLLAGHERARVHGALVAWERSPETFGEEIVALNDIDETLRNNCPDETSRQKS
jgi:hypothetical protein